MVLEIDNGKKVLSMKLLNIDNDEEKLLFEREGSQCLFNDDFSFGEYEIVLRADWGDVRNGEPVLDADIYKKEVGRKRKKIRTGPWHHTEKAFDNVAGCCLYTLNFRNLSLRLMSKISFGLGVSLDAILISKTDSSA